MESSKTGVTGINKKFKYKAINLFKVNTDVIELSVTKGIFFISYSNVREAGENFGPSIIMKTSKSS